jgi:cysteine desulfurase/selenocysteine lyase
MPTSAMPATYHSGGSLPNSTSGGTVPTLPTSNLAWPAPTGGLANAAPMADGSQRYAEPASGQRHEPSGSPFDVAPSFDALPGFGLESMRLPMMEPERLDASPYWLPPEPTVGGNRVESNEPVRPSAGAFDPYAVRRDFPILEERVHGGKRLVWLDNAATTQKPRAVIDRLRHFYEHENSNVHRAAHTLAARATDAFESARETTRRFLNAPSASEIMFVRGATEGINLIAKTWGARHVEAGDEIILTHLEHHANIVPWQQLCAATGARLRVAPVDDRGDVILEEYERLFNSHTKLVAFTQVSNALGTITPAREMIEIAHRYGAIVLLDGAQAVSHLAVDVQALDCDFYVFSGHKVFAPTGIGAVFGKRALLDAMPPWQGGGNMIQDVTFEKTTYQPPPGRFEAGTGNIADAAGMGAALEYVMRIGMSTIDRYEHELLVYATDRLATVPGLTMIGTSPNKAGVLSFVLDGQRTEDVGAALDKDGIAVRSGHHCAQPILRRFGLESSVRASLAFYNVCEDIDELVVALQRLQRGVR